MKNKFLALSFDDGTIKDERLVPLLNRYGIKASFHLNAGMIPLDGKIGQYDRLPLTCLQHLYSGHEVATHSFSHPDLTQLSKKEILDELTKDIAGLNAYFDQETNGFAYPFGLFSPTVIEVLKKTPLVYARTIRDTFGFALPTDPYLLDPTCHVNDAGLMDLTEAFLKEENDRKFFLIWGHSFEFDTKVDWDRFENFLKRISHHQDVFYGTIPECLDAMK